MLIQLETPHRAMMNSFIATSVFCPCLRCARSSLKAVFLFMLEASENKQVAEQCFLNLHLLSLPACTYEEVTHWNPCSPPWIVQSPYCREGEGEKRKSEVNIGKAVLLTHKWERKWISLTWGQHVTPWQPQQQMAFSSASLLQRVAKLSSDESHWEMGTWPLSKMYNLQEGS